MFDRTNMNNLHNYWYIVCQSKDIKNKPLAVTLFNTHIVLFRNKNGKITALRDLCSHRNVQLSKGKIKSGCIECPYHGWQFNDQGECVYVPSLCKGQKIPPKSTVQAYPIQEHQGYIWLCLEKDTPHLPFSLPYYQEKGWSHARFSITIRNSVDNIVENFIDCPHTGYIHGGLFREPASHNVKSIITAKSNSIAIDIDEQTKDSNSFLARILMGKDTKVTHIDQFILPSIVQVSYSFGEKLHITGLQICTPISDYLTKVFVHVTWNLGLCTKFVKPFVGVIGQYILKQDLWVLENQGEQLKKYGENFCSAPADTANNMITRLRKRAATESKIETKSEVSEREVNFRL